MIAEANLFPSAGRAINVRAMRLGLALVVACAVSSIACGSPARAEGRPPGVPTADAVYPELNALYIDLHQHPELSLHEERTAEKLAAALRQHGYEVTTGVGKTGVVGVLKNGPGPTVLFRTELDALPVAEKTGLPYASTVPEVMHACGHDVHMSAWVGTAALLAQNKQRWQGTLVFVGQPAEEIVAGAKAMIADGLFTRFPKPDFVVAVHDTSDAPAGTVSWVPGYAMANVDSIDLTIYGKGGHGARPEATIDPIVIAARMVLALQTIVSREKDPSEPAVLSVGSIHGGTKHNIIPDEVKLQMTLRTYKPEVRAQMRAAIERVAKAEAAAAGAPREPSVAFGQGQDATYNDPALTKRLGAAVARALGPANVTEGRPEMVSEDFGELGKAAHAPSVLLRVGAVDPARFAAAKASGERLPVLHSSTFAPDRERTIRTAVTALTASALDLLGKR